MEDDLQTTGAQAGAAATDAANGAAENAEQAHEIALSLAEQAQQFFEGLLRPWNAYQIGIALVIFVISYGLAKIVSPRLREWMRTRENWPKWRYRFFLVVDRRMRLILFVLIIFPVLFLMREITWPAPYNFHWPSRTYLLGLIAQLALAWLVIALITRLIKNGFLRSVVRYAGWIWVTLTITGLRDEARGLLDSVAFELGETRISLWVLVQAFFMLGLLFSLARVASKATASGVQSNEEISPSMRVLVVKFAQVALYGLALFVGLRVIGVDLTGLAFLSGAIGVGLGFGLQKVVSNLVSGVIILLDKSIKPGDVISLGDTFGWINTLGARYTSVVTRDGKEYLIPNEDLITGQVVNWSHTNDFVRLDIYFGTAYGDDPHKVRALAIEAAQSVDRVLSHKPPVCHIVGFGDSSVDYILRFWITDPTGGLTNIRGNVYLALWDAFQENGISIPFPQREVRMLGDGD